MTPFCFIILMQWHSFLKCLFRRPLVWPGDLVQRFLSYDSRNQDEPDPTGKGGRKLRRTGERRVREFQKTNVSSSLVPKYLGFFFYLFFFCVLLMGYFFCWMYLSFPLFAVSTGLISLWMWSLNGELNQGFSKVSHYVVHVSPCFPPHPLCSACAHRSSFPNPWLGL